MKSVSTFLFSLIMLLVVTTAKSSERGLFKRAIFPPISPTIPIITTTTTSVPPPQPTTPTPLPPPPPPSPPPQPAPPASPISTASTPTVTVTILSTSFLPAVTPTLPASQATEVPSTTVEVIKTVAPAPNPTDSGSDSYYEGNGNSLIVEGIGIKMSIAAVFLNVFYVLFA